MRTIVHAYNTTMNMKIDGKGYLDFTDDILEPLLCDIIRVNKNFVSQQNSFVLKQVKKSPKCRNNQKKSTFTFKCEQCDESFQTDPLLNGHKENEHCDYSPNSPPMNLRRLKIM